MQEHDMNLQGGPPTDSLDSTSHTTISGRTVARVKHEIPIALSPNNKQADVRMVADVLLKDIRHSTETYFAYCRYHKVLTYQEVVGGKGATWFDSAHNMHFKPFCFDCGDPLPVPRELVFQMTDMENPRLGEFFDKVVQLKESLDEHLANKAILENKNRRRYIQE
jgi:hypothetical protein